MNSEVIEANIKVHSVMADTYNQNEPHFRPENRAKVRAVLEKLKLQCKGDRLLDIGCGTGFVIDLARDLFKEIHGVDVTQPMLDKVDISSGNIKLYNVAAEALPFENNYFDMISSYAFIHHVEDYEKVLKEAFRVLKPGGICYIDLEPNKLFWEAMVNCDQLENNYKSHLSKIVLKEINSVLYTDESVEKEFGIEKDLFNKAEFTKSILGGIDPFKFANQVKRIGFSECKVNYEWFLGQGNVMHSQSFKDAEIISTYLKQVLPMASNLFKYLQFILIK